MHDLDDRLTFGKMNLFLLHPDPRICAKYHCDVHVVKMILETVQLLYSCHWRHHSLQLQMDLHPPAYKPTHLHHPCSLWVGYAAEHYAWALALAQALCSEYQDRTGHVHKCASHLERLEEWGYPSHTQPVPIPPVVATLRIPPKCQWFPLAMPDLHKRWFSLWDKSGSGYDAMLSYQSFYREKLQTWACRTDKKKMRMKWTGRRVPDFVSAHTFTCKAHTHDRTVFAPYHRP